MIFVYICVETTTVIGSAFATRNSCIKILFCEFWMFRVVPMKAKSKTLYGCDGIALTAAISKLTASLLARI